MPKPTAAPWDGFYIGAAGLMVGDDVPHELGPIPHDQAVRVFYNRHRGEIPPGRVLYAVEAHSASIWRRNHYEFAFVTGATVTEVLTSPQPVVAPAGAVEQSADEPLIGFRNWCFCGAPMEGLLTVAIPGGYIFPMWQPGVTSGEWCVTCGRGDGSCSSPSQCGLIAFDSLDASRHHSGRHLDGSVTYPIVGVVKTWGATVQGGMKTLEDEHGWRAEFGELIALGVFPECEQDERLDREFSAVIARRYGVPLLDRSDLASMAAKSRLRRFRPPTTRRFRSGARSFTGAD
jgi:hypothetical protein